MDLNYRQTANLNLDPAKDLTDYDLSVENDAIRFKPRWRLNDPGFCCNMATLVARLANLKAARAGYGTESKWRADITETQAAISMLKIALAKANPAK